MKKKLIHGFDFDKIDLSSPVKKKPTTNNIDNPFAIPTAEANNIIDIIFLKMQKKGGFPSFSKQISDINKILKLKYASAKDIANVIMKDFSLSNKLLKLVNSSFYGQFSKKGISSVEKAMIILGADQVQQAAASLMLFEHMKTSSNSDELKNIAVKTFMSGLIAKDFAIAKRFSDSEEFLICAMFYRLGENLIAYYFSEKREIINKLATNNSIEKSSHQVLGISYQNLGAGIAQKWGLPDNIIKSMNVKRPERQSLTQIDISRVQALGLIAAFSNELCEIQFSLEPADRSSVIIRLIRDYHGRIDISPEIIDKILKSVTNKIREHSSHLDINTETCKELFK